MAFFYLLEHKKRLATFSFVLGCLYAGTTAIFIFGTVAAATVCLFIESGCPMFTPLSRNASP